MDDEVNKQLSGWQQIKPLVSLIIAPLLAILIAYGIYMGSVYFSGTFFPDLGVQIQALLLIILQITIAFCIYWFLIKILSFFRFQFQIYFKKHESKYAFLLINLFANALKVIIFLSLASFIIDLLPLPPHYNYFAEKLMSIFIIVAITLIIIQLIKITESIVMTKYNIQARTDLLAQNTLTQIMILRRTAMSLVILLAVGSILFLFENVRNLGTGLLTSAGIIAVVGTFAVKRPLENLADSLQIIFNRLIKINDMLIVEKEFGTVEEINLNYVVIKIWDLRRLIIPIHYFIENPFINLSRNSTDILGIAKLYVDYTLPVDKVRASLRQIAEQSSFWDKRTCILEVTDSLQSTIELRMLLSAQTPDDAWKLQCEAREKLIQCIRENYPESLPRFRTEMHASRADKVQKDERKKKGIEMIV